MKQTLSQATWTRYGDQPFTFPAFKVQMREREQKDVFTLKITSIGQWLIVPVVQEHEKSFSQREIIGWTCVAPESPTDYWRQRYACPMIFPTQKKARVWAEQYRLFPLYMMEPILENPQDYREAF